MTDVTNDVGQKLFCLCDFPCYFCIPYCVPGDCREEAGIPSFRARGTWC